jgi:NADPH:quinone reductase-like Zn-dependent oxidoreductase
VESWSRCPAACPPSSRPLHRSGACASPASWWSRTTLRSRRSPLVDSGQLRVLLERTFRLDEADKAHEHGQAGRSFGKIVLTVPDRN